MPTKPRTPDQVDVRGPRFAAWVTTAVIVATLLIWPLHPVASAVLLAAQAVVFAVGAWLGPRRHPYGLLFARLIAPRLGPVTDREPAPPLRFAQFVGFVFAGVGVAGFALGVPTLGLIAAGLALAAAFLNAAFGICLGCQIYPLVARISSTPSPV
ncbi:DUF4395 domain-containing protein [Mycolicibacterium flavescens]|uniref:DUF4395 domain-containing protein n=1 Tax=Mycolicibacterium flavescens TaxID=1776 RepID=A0A1E3RJJ8_MYCFV|nr:DUF4395 domain-containing protein [Mycolicibacterium flavescens]MCV7280587.1 DUF4395 domain-containing protein [Mycolicibacterium flavescens]ODQ90029.1 hypothetical protein BHQ18_11280 [Mycolicibacterium flavescens]